MSWKQRSNQSEFGILELLAFLGRAWPMAVLFAAVVTAHTYWSFKRAPAFTASGVFLMETSSSSSAQAIAEKISGMGGGRGFDEDAMMEKYMMLFTSQSFSIDVAKVMMRSGKAAEFLALIGESPALANDSIKLGERVLTTVEFAKGLNSTVRIATTQPEPERAVKAINLVQEALVAAIIERESLDLSAAKHFLEDQVTEVEKRLSFLDADIARVSMTAPHVRAALASGKLEGNSMIEKLDKELVEMKVELAETETLMDVAQSGANLENQNFGPADKYSPATSLTTLRRKADLLRIRIASTKKMLNEVVERAKSVPNDDKEREDIYKKKELEYQFYADLKKEIMSIDIQKISAQNRVKVMERAMPGSARANRNLMSMVGKRAMFAAILALMLYGLWELRNPVVRSRRDLSGLKVSFLGSIPNLDRRGSLGFLRSVFHFGNRRRRNRKDFMHVLDLEPDSFHDMIFKNVRARIMNFTNEKGKSPQVISIMSGSSGEGKTSISSNLSKSFSMGGKRVLLIDADLRRHSLTTALGMQNEKGLTEYLTSPADHHSKPLVKRIGVDIDLLPAGQYTPHCTELISGKHFREVLDAMKHYYDYIFLDTPPAIPYSEVVPIAAASDLVVMSVLAGGTKIEAVEQLVDKIQFGVKTPIGYVLNMQEDQHMDAYYPYYQQKGGAPRKPAA